MNITNLHPEMGKNLKVYVYFMSENIQMKVFNGFIRNQENTNELSWVFTLTMVSIKSLPVSTPETH